MRPKHDRRNRAVLEMRPRSPGVLGRRPGPAEAVAGLRLPDRRVYPGGSRGCRGRRFCPSEDSHRKLFPFGSSPRGCRASGHASEGRIIEAVAPAWSEIAKLIAADPSVMYRIAPRKWEELIAGWYKAHGFDEVILTPASGDPGRDVIAVKRGVLSVRIIDQVKAERPGHLVPANAVRALLGVLGSDRGATKGLVTTASDFAPMIKTDELSTR